MKKTTTVFILSLLFILQSCDPDDVSPDIPTKFVTTYHIELIKGTDTTIFNSTSLDQNGMLYSKVEDITTISIQTYLNNDGSDKVSIDLKLDHLNNPYAIHDESQRVDGEPFSTFVLFLNDLPHIAYSGSSSNTHNGSRLCVRAGNRSTKADIITKVQLKNYC